MTAANFSSYGKSFQERLMQALLVDRQFAEQMAEVFNVDYFEQKYLKFLAGKYFAYVGKYKVFPTLQLLVTIIKDELKIGTDTLLRDQIVEYLQRIKTNPDIGDLPYVKEKSLDFCRKQALKAALEEAVDQMQADKYESIVDTIKKAVTVGVTPQLGHDFFTDYEARFTQLERACVPTGFEELDKKGIFSGGISAGELFVVVAPSGIGKSHFLTNIGASALRHQKNVLHYTLEMSETAVGRRYDSNLCDINSDDIFSNKDAILQKYNEMQLGKLIIKEFPTNSATIFTIRAHMERLELKGFRPDIVIVDYADIMRSTRQYDSPRHELKLIYQELRGLAAEKKLGLWTASQANKEGANADIIDTTNMSESYGKAAECDAVISLSRKNFEKATGAGRLFLAKNRNGQDGLLYPIKIDTARSKFEFLGGPRSPDEAKSEDATDFKKKLKQRWNELSNDPKVVPTKTETV